MRPDRIPEILNLALQARGKDLTFNPLFVGEAGLGKSQIIRQWVKKQQETDPDFGFIDFRLAYYEGPDFVGYPRDYQDDTGRWRMEHALPKMWPTKGRGLILFEEPNRGNTMVMNCMMQILTDREVGTDYKLPEGWILAGAMNPEGSKYDVNAMDTALMDRFEIFNVDFDHNTFLHFIETAKWHKNVVNFVKSSMWVYKTPDTIAKDGKYVSPRTLDKLNSAEMAGASDHETKRALHLIIAQSVLGKHLGMEYWKSCWDDSPVLASDLINDREKALQKLKEQSKAGNSYAGDKISITVDSVVENYGGWFEGRKTPDGKDLPHQDGTVDEATMVAVAKIIPSDQAINMIKNAGYKAHKGQVRSYFKDFYKRNPEAIEIMRDHIKLDNAVSKDK